MGIITITSDWGQKDPYLASVKGAILQQAKDIQIVDITHDIISFDIFEPAFIIKSCFQNFPDGTVHLLGVNTEASLNRPHVLMKYKGHFFIGADNGIFALIAGKEKVEYFIEITLFQDTDYFTFPTRDLFVKTAVKLLKGAKPNELGVERKQMTPGMELEPLIEKNTIKGHVIYIDKNENLITNIREDLFKGSTEKKDFQILLRNAQYEINKISRSYSDVAGGEILALFGVGGLLEIAISYGNASGLLGVKLKDIIRIELFEKNE